MKNNEFYFVAFRGQQVAAQMQNVNPDLVEQLRRQMVGKEEATILLE